MSFLHIIPSVIGSMLLIFTPIYCLFHLAMQLRPLHFSNTATQRVLEFSRIHPLYRASGIMCYWLPGVRRIISYASCFHKGLCLNWYLFHLFVSISFPEKETHGSNTSSFSLLPCPFLSRDERVTFLIRDTKKRDRGGMCGSHGDVPFRSPFKKELAKAT